MASRRGRNEGSIYKRNDGRWTAYLNLGWNPSGTRNRKYFYGQTRDEVAKKLAKALRDLQQGIHPADDRQTVGQFLEFWLRESAKPMVRPSTYASYETICRVHLVPEIGRTKLSQLTPQRVQKLLNDKSATGLSPRRVQRIHAVLRTALKRAMSWDLVQRNVAALADPPPAEKYLCNPYTEEEARQLLDAVRGSRLEAVYTVAVAIGLRVGEILGLQWDDLDLEASTLTVKRQLQRVKGQGLVFSEPKSTSSRRTVTLPAYAVAALSKHKLAQDQERALNEPGWNEHGLVFCRPKGTPFEANSLYRELKKVAKKAKLREQSFHDLRRCCVTLLLAQGVPARMMMELLGHTDISLTMNAYAHILPAVAQDAADKMDGVLGRNE